MFRSLFLAGALALGLAGVAHATASDLSFYAAKSTLLANGNTTTDATTNLVSGPAVVVTSGSKVSDLNALIVVQVTSPVADGGSFDLTCTSGTTGSIGSASAAVTITSKTTSPVAASNQYALASASSTAPVTISFPSLTAGSACAPGLVCGAGTTAVTITCAVSATSGTTLPSTLTAGTYAFTVNVVDPIPAGVDATLTCAVSSDVTGAYLSSAKTTASDATTATVTATPLVLSILPGTSAIRGDTGASFLTNQKLTTNDSVQAIEGNAYGAGGLFKVVLDQNAPEALTVTCLVDSTMSAVLANSTTSSDYTVSIASGSGTTASSITLPAVQSISKTSTVQLTCTATNAAGRVYSTASTNVAATPLQLVITAKSGAINTIKTDGTYTTFSADTDLSSKNNQVVRIEGQADSAGGTVTIKANSAPTAAVTITCTPSDTTVIPSVTVATTISTGTAVNLTIGTVAAISKSQSITITCYPSASAGGLSTTDIVTFTVVADPVRFIVKAQTTAIQSVKTTNELVNFSSETALVSVIGGSSNGTVYRLEGQADSSGNTLKVYMNAVPTSGSYTLTCSTTGATYTANPALASAVASANSLSGTGVGVDLKTMSDVSTPTSSVVTCYVTSGADTYVTTSDGFAVNVMAQPLGFIVTAQSTAIKSVASTNALTTFNSAQTLTAVQGGSSNGTVYLLEGQTDSGTADTTIITLSAKAVNTSFTTKVTPTSSAGTAVGQTVNAASATVAQQDVVVVGGTWATTTPDQIAVEVDPSSSVATTVTYKVNSGDGTTAANVGAGLKAALTSPLGGATIATNNVIVLTATTAGTAIDTYSVAPTSTSGQAAFKNLVASGTGVAQVDAIAVGGTYAAGDTIKVTYGAVATTYTVNSVDGTTVANVTAGLLKAMSSPLDSGGSASASSSVLTITLGTGLSVAVANTNAGTAGFTVSGTGPFTIGGTWASGDSITVTVKSTATGTPTLYTVAYTPTASVTTAAAATAVATALTKTLNGTASASTANAFTITAGTAGTALPSYSVTVTQSTGSTGSKATGTPIANGTGISQVDVVYLGGMFVVGDKVTVTYPTSANVSTTLVNTVTSTSAATNATALASALSSPIGNVTVANFPGGSILQVQLNGNSGGSNLLSCTTTTGTDFYNSLLPVAAPVSTTTNVAINKLAITDAWNGAERRRRSDGWILY